jgi:hypothetical protein
MAVCCAAVLLCLLATLSARADEPTSHSDEPPPAAQTFAPPPTTGPPVATSQAEVDARLRELDEDFEKLRRPQRAYIHGWIWGLTAICVAQTTLAVLEDDDKAQRTIYSLGAGLSLAGVAVVAGLQARSRKAARAYRDAHEGGAPKAQQLELAEDLMRQHVLAMKRTRGWYMHVAAVGLGTAITLGLGFAYDDLWTKAVVAGVGAALGVELRVWTHPTRGLKLAERYQRHWPNAQILPIAGKNALGLAWVASF